MVTYSSDFQNVVIYVVAYRLYVKYVVIYVADYRLAWVPEWLTDGVPRKIRLY